MNMRRQSLNFAGAGPRAAPRGRDGKELIQCPTSSCDGMGHVSGNYATHRRQGSLISLDGAVVTDFLFNNCILIFFFSRISHYIRIYLLVLISLSYLSPLFFVWHDTHDNHTATRDKSYDHEIYAKEVNNYFNCSLDIIIILLFFIWTNYTSKIIFILH